MPSINGVVLCTKIESEDAEAFRRIAESRGMSTSGMLKVLIKGLNSGAVEVRNGAVRKAEVTLSGAQINVLTRAERKMHCETAQGCLDKAIEMIREQL